GWPVLLLVVACAACTSRKKAPDVSHIPVTVSIDRFDRDLVAIDTNRVAEGLDSLHARYPVFLPAYLQHIMAFGAYNESTDRIPEQTRLMLVNKDFRSLQNAVQQKFRDLNRLEQDLAQ